MGDWDSEIGGKVAVLIRGNQKSDGFMDQNLASSPYTQGMQLLSMPDCERMNACHSSID